MQLTIVFILFFFILTTNGNKNTCLHNESNGKHCTSITRRPRQKLILPSASQNKKCYDLCIESGYKNGGKSVYRCEILNREFMFSDQLETVISGLYGHNIAEQTHFYVDQKRVNRYSLLDEHQGKDIHVYYHDNIHDSDRIGSFSVPVLEHHQTLRHHQIDLIK